MCVLRHMCINLYVSICIRNFIFKIKWYGTDTEWKNWSVEKKKESKNVHVFLYQSTFLDSFLDSLFFSTDQFFRSCQCHTILL